MAELRSDATCSSTSSAYESNWSAYKYCFQGSYNGGTPRVGGLLFDDLRDYVSWDSKNITEITLTASFGAAGWNEEKTLYLYRGNKTSFYGSGLDMVDSSTDDYIGSVSTNGDAFSSTNTITFNSYTNSSLFYNLVDWLQNKTSTILLLFHNETSSSGSYSDNYLQINAATLTIIYEDEEIITPNNTINYGINNTFQECEIYYGTEEKWVKVKPYFGIGGVFVEIGN